MHLPYLLLCISLCSCPASDMSNSKTKLFWNLVVSRMGNPIFHSVYTTSPQHRKNWLKENKLRFNLHLTTCFHKHVQVQSQIHCISYVKTNFCQGRPQERAQFILQQLQSYDHNGWLLDSVNWSFKVKNLAPAQDGTKVSRRLLSFTHGQPRCPS